MKLLGSARFDRKQGRFVGFEVVAVGTRWGATQYNVRGNDLRRPPSERCSPLPARAGPSASRRSISAATETFRNQCRPSGHFTLWDGPSRPWRWRARPVGRSNPSPLECRVGGCFAAAIHLDPAPLEWK